jgi:DNA-binding NarL/FixJ family response regulator
MAIQVFIADDHAVVRDGLRLLIEAQTNIVVVGEAANGREAVQLATHLKPEVVVMDIAMTKLNGIEATSQIRARCPVTQVVVLSMHSTREYIVRAFEAGALGYVLKESAGADVVDAIRAAHAGRRYVSRQIGDLERHANGGLSSSPLGALSDREREVLQLTVEGTSTVQIAEMLALSPKTVETYRCRLMAKLSLNDLPSLVKFAIKYGLTPLE